MTPSEILLNRELDALRKSGRWLHYNFMQEGPKPVDAKMTRQVDEALRKTMVCLVEVAHELDKAAYSMEHIRRVREGNLVELKREDFEYQYLDNGLDIYDRLMPFKRNDDADDELLERQLDAAARQHQRIEEILSCPTHGVCFGQDGKIDPHLLRFDHTCYRLWLRVVTAHSVLQRLIATLSYRILSELGKGASGQATEATEATEPAEAEVTIDGTLESWVADLIAKNTHTGRN